MATPVEVSILLKAHDDASKVLQNVGKLALGLGVAFVGAAGAAVKAAADEEIGIKRLQQAFKNAGKTLDEELNFKVETWIGHMEHWTAFSDGELRDALSLLVSMTGDAEEGMSRLSIATDLARGTGMDLTTAAKLLGKVTDENTTALRRYGIVVKDGATATDLLAAVQQKFGGQAEAFAETTAGQMTILQNELGNLMEDVGSVLLPLFTEGVKVVSGFVSELRGNGMLEAAAKAFKTIIEIVGEFFGVITGSAPNAGAKLKEIVGPRVAGEIMGGLAMIREAFKAAFTFIQENVIPPLIQAFQFLSENWESVAFAMKVIAVAVIIPMFIAWAAAAAAAAAATILALLPVVVPLALIGTAVFLMHKVWTENLAGIQEKTKAVVDFIFAVLDALATTWANIWNGIVTTTQNAVALVVAPIMAIIRAVQDAISALQRLTSQQAGGGFYGGPEESFASGTPYVPRTMLAMVHQGERIIPADQNRAGNWGGGMPREIHLYIDGKEVKAVVSERQLRDVRLAGGAV
jgi:hypothetical protein